MTQINWKTEPLVPVNIRCQMSANQHDLENAKHVMSLCMSVFQRSTKHHNIPKLVSGRIKYNHGDLKSCGTVYFHLKSLLQKSTVPDYYVGEGEQEIEMKKGAVSCIYHSDIQILARNLSSCVVQLMDGQANSESLIQFPSQGSSSSCSSQQSRRARDEDIDSAGRGSELGSRKRTKILTKSDPSFGTWVINEVFIQSGNEILGSDFIELRWTGLQNKKPASLKNHKLIAITNLHVDNGARVDFIVDLSRSSSHNNLFTVGGSNYDCDIQGTGCVTKRKQGFTFYRECNKQIRYTGHDSNEPYILLLVKDDNPLIRVTKECTAMVLNEQEVEQLRSIVIDSVVYRQEAETVEWDLADELTLMEKPYILRYFFRQSSIGRCSDLNQAPKQPKIFKSMHPTFNLHPNQCDEQFFLLDNPNDNEVLPLNPPDHEGGDQRSSASIASQIDRENLLSDLENRLRSRGGDPPVRNWESFSYFNRSWIQFLVPQYVSAEMINQNMNWLTVERIGNETRLGCRLCANHHSIQHVRVNQRSVFASGGYRLRDSRQRHLNNQRINSHAQSTFHTAVLEDLAQANINTINYQMGYTMTNPTDDERIFGVTAAVMRTVYSAVHNSIAIRTIESLIEVQNLNQNNQFALGYHHNNKRSHHQIIEMISRVMNSEQFKPINRTPWTLSVDGTTDRSNRFFLVVNISYVCRISHKLITKFLDILHMEGSTIASQQAEALISALNSYGVGEGVNNTLVAFNSDSAAVNVGAKHSILTQLQKYRRGPLLSYGCRAHNLHLALSDSFKLFEQIGWIENIMEEVRKFITTGYKRANIYREVSSLMGETALALGKLSPLRWITSEFDIMHKYLKLYVQLVKTLERISAGIPTGVEPTENFDRTTKARAHSLANSMREKNNLLWTAAILDMLTPLSILNQALQRNDFTIVDSVLLVEECLNQLRTLARTSSINTNVPNIQRILMSSVSTATNTVPGELEDFVAENNWRLYSGTSSAPYTGESITITRGSSGYSFSWSDMSSIMNDTIRSIERRMINKENLRHLKILRGDLIPTDVEAIGRHIDSILIDDQLPAFAHAYPSVADFRRELIELFTAISSDTDFLKRKSSNSVAFWTYYMDCLPGKFSETMINLILSVLSVPVSNAQCERTISIMSNAQRKAPTTPVATLRRLVNLRSNGPVVPEFDAIRMAKEWIRLGHWLSDCKTRMPQEVPNANENTCEGTDEESGIEIEGIGFVAGAVGGSDPNELGDTATSDDDDEAWDELN